MTRISPEKLRQAFSSDKVQHLEFDGLAYERLTDSSGPVPRGSVRLPDGSVIPGYPSIGRIQTLASGLTRQFQGPFRAEEKMDGFNIRIVHHEGRLLAFSRGGFICPFSVDRVPEFLDPAIFDEKPALVVCAELAGPDNPYIEGAPPQVSTDIDLFIFDLMHRDAGGFLSLVDKHALIERYGLPAAADFGEFHPDQTEGIRELMRELDARGAEGVVFKSDAGDGTRAKYVTARSNIHDLELTSSALLDLPPEYFTNRLLRMALFMAENGQRGDRDLEWALGHSLLQGLFNAADSAGENGLVDHPFRCRFRDRANAERFIRFLKSTGGKHMRFPEDGLYQEGAFWVLEFRRVRDRMTSWLRHTLWGGRQFD